MRRLSECDARCVRCPAWRRMRRPFRRDGARNRRCVGRFEELPVVCCRADTTRNCRRPSPRRYPTPATAARRRSVARSSRMVCPPVSRRRRDYARQRARSAQPESCRRLWKDSGVSCAPRAIVGTARDEPASARAAPRPRRAWHPRRVSPTIGVSCSGFDRSPGVAPDDSDQCERIAAR